MKKLILATALLTTAPVMASDYCGQIGDLAETVMTVRQNGAEMSGLMNIMLKEEATKVIGKQMVIDAYETPRYNMLENQKREVSEFKNEWYLLCIKAGE
jgi:hypothetical protein